MDSSPLSTLPAELRALIFQYALTHPKPIKVHLDNTPNKHPRFDSQKNPPNPTALLRTCRQIHHESAKLFYSTSRFLLPSRASIVHFASPLRRNAEHLRTVIIEEIISLGYFGHEPRQFRSAVRFVAEDPMLPQTCRVYVRPVFVMNRKIYAEAEFEALMEDAQLDVRDVESSLTRSLERLAGRMQGEEDQEKWTDFFWAKRLYTQYLEYDEEKEESRKAKRPLSRAEYAIRARKILGDRSAGSS